MDLQELKFVVVTDDLDKAAKKIEALGTAVSKINKPITQAALDTEKLAQAQAKTAAAAAKVEEAEAKTAIAKEKVAKAQEKVNSSLSTGNAIAERQAEILRFQTEGYSKGQAATLAAAKAAGALDSVLEKLGVTLKDQRVLMGGQPFDNSIGLMQKLENETRISTEVNNLFNKSLGLTEKQLIDLAREHERLTKKYELEGRSLDGLTTEYEQLIAKSVELTRTNDSRTKAIRDQVKEQNAAAKATQYITDADARLAAALDVTNAKLDKQASDAFVKYEKALRQSGKSAEEVAAKLAVAKTQFEAIADKKQADKLQYLARAISVQMGDVGISLASGMNPLLVMIQQGDQIRGAIQQAGASGKELEKAMSNAAVQIASSFVDTGKAIGGFFVSAVKSAGQAVLGFPFELMKAGFNAATQGTESFSVSMDRLKVSLGSFAKVGILAIIATLAALAMEYVKVSAAEKELTKSLALSGAALGMSTETAIKYAESMNQVGIGTLDAMKLIGEFANTGADASIPLEQIIKSAKDMEKYVGIASKDTMKAFSDISEKPVEGLIKLAKSTGNVSKETILLAESLMKSGKEAEAAQVAQEALKNSNEEVVKRMKNNLDPLQTLWLDIKSGISKAGEALYDFLKSSTVVAIFRTAWETVAVIVSEVWYVLKQTGTEISGIASQIKAVMTGDFSGAAKIGADMKANAELARIEQDKLTASILNRNKAEKETLTVTEQQRQVNRKAAKDIEDRLKNQKAATFNIPEDTQLKKLENDYKNSIKTIDSESSKLISESKVRYALGISDLGDFLNEETRLIVDQNAQKISSTEQYIKDLNKAEEDQINAVKKATAVARSHAKTKDDIEALNKKEIETVKSLRESYNRLTESAKTQIEVFKDKTVEQQIKTIEQLGALTKKVIEGSQDFITTQDDIIKKRQLQIDLDRKLINLYGAEAERVKAQVIMEQSHIDKLSELEVAALKAGVAFSKIKLSGLDENDPKYKLASEAVNKANQSLDEARVKSKTAIVQAGIDAEVKYYEQEYQRISNTISDAIVTALFEGGKAGSKKIRDLIIAELKKPITIVVKALVDATLGSFAQGALSGASNSAGSSMFGSAIGNAAASYGASIFGSNAAYGAAIGTTNVAAGSQAAMLAQQTGAFGAQGAYATAQAAGTTASAAEMAMTAGPYVLAAVAALNALGAFKTTKTVGGGITGTLGAGNLESYNLTRTSGSLLSGPSYKASSQGATEATNALENAFVTMRSAIASTADSLGFSTDKIKTFTMAVGDIKIHPDIAQLGLVLDGLSDEQKVAKINEVLTKSGNAMAEIILGAGTTLEKLKSTFDFFYQNFYTESEKFANLTKDLTDGFAKLNIPLPKTREQFKQLVLAAQKAGDTALLKGLTDLQYSFAELVPAAQTATASVTDLADGIKTMYTKFVELTGTKAELDAYTRSQVIESTDPATRAIQAYLFALEDVKTTSDALTKSQDAVTEAEKRLTSARADALSSLISTTKNFIDSLRKFSQSLLLGGLSTFTPEQKYNESRKQLDDLLKIATGSATTPQEIAKRDDALNSLQGAATSFLDASKIYNASSAQYTSDFEYVQKAISMTADALDTQVTEAQKQLQALGSIDTGISAVEKAINDLATANASYADAQMQFNKALEAAGVLRPAATEAYSSANAVINNQAALENGKIYGKNKSSIGTQEAIGFINNYVANTNAGTAGFTARGLYDVLQEWGVNSDLLATLTGYSKAAILEWFQSQDNTIPAFAKGTNYVPSDMYAKIHEGERIIPAADNARLMQSLNNRNETNAILVTEIKNLRQEIVELRNQQSKETATIVISNIDAQQKNAERVGEVISKTSQESNWNAKVRETVKLK